MDLAPIQHSITLKSIQDGVSWEPGRIDWSNGGWATIWVDGLTVEADPGNTMLDVAGIPHSAHAVHGPTGQINIQLRPLLGPGMHPVRLTHRGVVSKTVLFEISGFPPAIRGLESLGAKPPQPSLPR